MKIYHWNKQLKVSIGRLEFGWDTPSYRIDRRRWWVPFHPYIYVHPKWSTPCCGGMGTGCQHEDYMYEIEHGGY